MNTPTNSPPTPAWKSPAAIGLFAAIGLGVLLGDLWLKRWAFAEVADEPVRLRSDGDGQPVVMLQDGSGGWFDAARRDPDEPASAIPPHDERVLVPGVLSLRLTLNTGAVFGLARGGRIIFIAVSVLAVAVIGYLFARSDRRALAAHLAFALILAGALGNLHDRYHFSAVRDMLHLFPTTRLWPWIFNLADAALMTGVALVMLTKLLEGRRGRAAETGRD